MMVDPFGDQTARLIHRGFGMVDTIKRGASAEGVHIAITVNHQLTIGCHDCTLTTPSDGAYVSRHPETAPNLTAHARANLPLLVYEGRI
jgi:hypothetical protein